MDNGRYVEWNGLFLYVWKLRDNCEYVEWNYLYLHVWNLVDNCEYVEMNGLCMVFICVESCG